MDTVHECDRRTDGQTDRITITDTVQRIASHGKKQARIRTVRESDNGQVIRTVLLMLQFTSGEFWRHPGSLKVLLVGLMSLSAGCVYQLSVYHLRRRTSAHSTHYAVIGPMVWC